MSVPSPANIADAFEAMLGRPLVDPGDWAAFTSLKDVIRAIQNSDEYRMIQKSGALWYSNSQIDLASIVIAHEDKSRVAVADRIVNFLGVVVDPIYIPYLLEPMRGEVQGLPLPANWHADLAEFGAALRAVDLAGDTFRVIELGCGWGCWIANTGVAARNRKKAVEALGVEGDRGHVAFAKRNMRENGFDEASFHIHHAIVGPVPGTALFPKQETAGVQYGLQPILHATPEQIADATTSGQYDVLQVMTLDAVARGKPVDLLHIDIQGGEADFVDACMEDLVALVRYVVIGTHSRLIEGRIFDAMRARGWTLEVERPAFFGFDHHRNPYLTIDGVQAWRNPRL